MKRFDKRFAIVLAAGFGALVPTVTASAAVTASSAFVFLTGGAYARTADRSFSGPYAFNLTGFSADPIATQTVSDNRSGTFNNTTGGGTAATASGSVVANGSTVFNAGSLDSFSVGGNYASATNITSLAGYTPTGAPAGVALGIDNLASYQSGAVFTVNAPTPVTMTITLARTFGFAANSGNLILDANNNGQYDPNTADRIIFSATVVGDGLEMRTAVLLPAAGVYRLSFFGNTSDYTSAAGASTTASAIYTSNVSFGPAIPEPGMMAAVLPAAAMLGRRRR